MRNFKDFNLEPDDQDGISTLMSVVIVLVVVVITGLALYLITK